MRRILIAFILLFVALPAQAKDKFLDIKEVRSKSGVTAWLVEDHSMPLIAMQFAFQDAGTIHDPKNLQGRTQLLSNTLDEGAGNLDSQSFQKALSDHSITLRFSSSRDNFSGRVKTLTRTQDKAFDLLKLALTQPRFDADPVNRMRLANMTRIQSSVSDPEWMAARILNDVAYQGHPYALNSGGTLSTLQKITPQDLRDIAKSRLGKDRLFVSVTGDITEEELKDVLEQIFGSLPNDTPLESAEETTVQNQGAITLYKQDIPQTIIQVMLPAFGRDDEDYYALQVMNYLFGGAGFGSYLMEEAREKRGLTYGIYSGIDDTLYIDTLSIGTSTKNESVKEMMDIIKEQMIRMKTTKVEEKKLQHAKSYLIGSMPLSLSSTDNIAGMMLSMQLQDLPIDYLDNYADNINAVTVDDIQRVAVRILKPETMTTVMVGNPADIEPTTIIETLPNVE